MTTEPMREVIELAKDVTVTLTADEAAFVLNELYSQGHGHGSSQDDFEAECPSCTAADKLAAAIRARGEGSGNADQA